MLIVVEQLTEHYDFSDQPAACKRPNISWTQHAEDRPLHVDARSDGRKDMHKICMQIIGNNKDQTLFVSVVSVVSIAWLCML